MIEKLLNALRLPEHPTVIALPPGTQMIPKELFDAEPVNKHGAISMESLSSLVDYTTRFGTCHSIILASLENLKITAIMDWHDPATPEWSGWADHSATYPLKLTREWQEWNAISGKSLSQKDFAEFIEEHLDEIKEPSSSDVLTVVTTLTGKRKVNFTNATSLGNGDVSLQWEEITDAKGAGDIRVPSQIVLAIPVFRGASDETTFEIKALFRYRIQDGRLSFEIKLLHADKVLDLAFAQIVASLSESFPDVATNSPKIVIGSMITTPREIIKTTIRTNQ